MLSTTRMRVKGAAALAGAGLALALVAGASPAAGSNASTKAEGPPIVSTGPAHAIGTLTELTGTINPHGLATTYYFEYGPTTKYGSRTKEEELKTDGSTDISVTQHVTQIVSGMQEGWHYVLVAKNAKGAKDGKDRVFTIKTKLVKSAISLPETFQPTLVGGTFVLSGTLTGSAAKEKRQVELQATPYPYRADFATVGQPITTTATGGFTFIVHDLTTSTRFRVVAPATATAPPLTSESLTQLAEARVTLHVQTSRHARGIVRLFGTVFPAETGARVFIQLEQTPKPKQTVTEKLEKKPREEVEHPPHFATRFTTIVKRATRTLSRFSVVVTVKVAGNYRAFVALAPGPLAPGQSQTVALRAAPKKKRKH